MATHYSKARTGSRGLNSAPMTLNQTITKLEHARRLWGGDTPVGVIIWGGSDCVMPLLEVRTPETRARCTIVANPCDWATARYANDLI